MSHLQTVLGEIAAETKRRNAMAKRSEAMINAAYDLRDRLIKIELFDPLMTLHWHDCNLQITIHAPTGMDDMFRIALAGQDIEALESAGRQHLGGGLDLYFVDSAKWYQTKEAA